MHSDEFAQNDGSNEKMENIGESEMDAGPTNQTSNLPEDENSV